MKTSTDAFLKTCGGNSRLLFGMKCAVEKILL